MGGIRARCRLLLAKLAAALRSHASFDLFTCACHRCLNRSFSVFSATLYHGLSFREPERLVQLNAYFAPIYEGRSAIAWKQKNSYLGEVAAYNTGEFTLNREPHSIRIQVIEGTANLFGMLGARLHIGRTFLAEEEIPGHGDVTILSHALYEQAFGGDQRLLGQKIFVNQRPLTVVGVAAVGFDYPQGASIWTPTSFDLAMIPKAGLSITTTIGRLEDDLSLEAANTALAVMVHRDLTAKIPMGIEAQKPRLIAMREQLAGPATKAVWVFFGSICVVLLIACANLSNLLLTRFAERLEEFRIRALLAAGIGRITQQILTECLLLSFSAGLLGLGDAFITTQLIARYYPPLFAFQAYEILEWRVLLFAFSLSLFCGLAFGLAPALLLREGQARRANRIRHSLLAVQVCLTLVLLCSFASLGKGLLDFTKWIWDSKWIR